MSIFNLVIVGGLVFLAFAFREPIKLALGLPFGQSTAETEVNDSIVSQAVNATVGSTPVISHSEAKQISAGAVAANNLKSNLTATPLPDDPLFGQNGFFTNILRTFDGSQDSQIQKQAAEVGLSSGDFHSSTDTQPARLRTSRSSVFR